MTRIGVTGATGFIGGALVPALARQNYDLVLVDNRSGPIRVEHAEWPAVCTEFEGPEGLRALSECDVILHLAAVSGVMACAEDPVASARTNVEGARRLLEVSRERRIPVAFASSLAVVGSPEQLPVSETTPARPTHEYARQKAAGEQLVRSTAEEAGLPSAVLRMSNVYGSYSAGPRTISKGNVLSLFLDQVRAGRLTVNAPGTQRRDFIHLQDVLAHWTAIVRWLRAPGTPAGAATFDVASGESFSVLEVADMVRRIQGRLRPDLPPVAVAVVPNPRAGIELVDPEFRVSRTVTERTLGIRCEHRVEEYLEQSLRA